MDQGQKSRWSKKEKDLLTSTFDGKDELLMQIRDVFYQFPTEPLVLPPEVMKLLRKVFAPGLSQDVPLRSQVSLHSAVDVDGIHPDIAVLHLKAMDVATDYIHKRLEVLEGKNHTGMVTIEQLKEAGNKTPEERFVTMKAALLLAHAYIDSCIETLKVGAQKEPTPQEIIEKARTNSSK